MWNYWINIELNRGWADGNIFLVAGTGYLTFQYVMSLGLFTGEKIWMNRMRHFRMFSFWTGVVYSCYYIANFMDYFFEGLNHKDQELAGIDIIKFMF